MPLLSNYAQKKKIDYFLKYIPKNAVVLEIGSGSQWLGKYMRQNGWKFYTGLDISAPADINGDINQWRQLGLKENSFDVIIAFEVVEHDDILDACYYLLKDSGELMITTPVPHMDWILKIFEWFGLNQKRTSPHSNLFYLRQMKSFSPVACRQIGFLSQWGRFRKVLKETVRA